MKFLLFLAAAVLVAEASKFRTLQTPWNQFKIAHNKTYKNAQEEAARLAIFNSNLKKIEEHNAKYEKGESTFKMGVNKFTDLTEEEFLAFLKTNGPPPKFTNAKAFTPNQVQARDTVDWRSNNIVTGVKDQGQCGSCWAFATTGSMEGQYALANNRVESFSEQCLVDCDSADSGCAGGWMASAMQYIQTNGIPTEAEYPYEAVDAQCRYNGGGTKISAVMQLTGSSESNLMLAVDQIGPIAVAIEASSVMQSYQSGVMNDNVCGHSLNHGVLVVGYGNENGQDYWLVKNSWGAGWGEAGYVKMSRNRDNQCGIADYGYFPQM